MIRRILTSFIQLHNLREISPSVMLKVSDLKVKGVGLVLLYDVLSRDLALPSLSLIFDLLLPLIFSILLDLEEDPSKERFDEFLARELSESSPSKSLEGAQGPSRVPISTSSPLTLRDCCPPCYESPITWPFSILSRLGYHVPRMTPMLMQIYKERLGLASTDAIDSGLGSSFDRPASLKYVSGLDRANLTKVFGVWDIHSLTRYGKIWYDEDVLDLRSVETEFPAIVFNGSLTLNETPSCEPTVSSPNGEIDFRISFDESDDEDYTVVFDKNSFSYKIISTSDLKTDSEKDNEKVNKPLFSSPEPVVSCINNLDFFKEFENEFRAIVYNDALMCKSDLSTEPTLCPQDIDEFDLKDEAALSEYDEVEQSVLDFLRGAPSYTYIRDPFQRLIDQGAANVPYLLAQYLFRHAEGRKSGARLSGGHFIRCLAHHFGLMSDDGLRGLFVVAREFPLIGMGELVATASAPRATKDAPAVDEGVQADPAPIQDVRTLRGLMERSMTDQGRLSTWMITCMTQLIEASGQTYQAIDGTFWRSSPATFQRRTRQRIGEASTSTTPQHPDP
ncbi:hypothetical protein Tco_0152975 [Tanacetum coccineum]